jgi:hypothetical protein
MSGKCFLREHEYITGHSILNRSPFETVFLDVTPIKEAVGTWHVKSRVTQSLLGIKVSEEGIHTATSHSAVI